MKMIVAILGLAVALTAKAAEVPKDPDPLFVMGAKKLAKVDLKTGKVEYQEGVDPKEVVDVLLRDVMNLQAALAEAKKSCSPKKK